MASSQVERESKVVDVIVLNSVFLGLATVSVAIRLYVRGVYLKGIGKDDVFCMISYAFTFALCFICAYMVKYGYGRHIQTLTPHDLNMFLKLDFATEISYVIAFVTIKMSFLFLYLKIFPGRTVIWVCYSLIAFLACQGIEELAVVIFQCTPVTKAWQPETPGKCLHLLPFFYVSFGIKLATDLVIFIYPIPILYKTKLPRGKKVGIMIMFLLGLLVCVTSIVRATFLTNTSTDISWILVDELNWSSVEVCVAIICACIPSFKTLVSYKSPAISKLLGLSTSETTGGSRSVSHLEHTFSSRHNRHIRLENVLSGSHIQTNVESVSRGDSEEYIFKPDDGIRVTTDVSVNQLP